MTYSSHAGLVVSDYFPLESIHPVRKPNVVIIAHCPLVSATPTWFAWWAFY